MYTMTYDASVNKAHILHKTTNDKYGEYCGGERKETRKAKQEADTVLPLQSLLTFFYSVPSFPV